jgi:hypothetical protein
VYDSYVIMYIFLANPFVIKLYPSDVDKILMVISAVVLIRILIICFYIFASTLTAEWSTNEKI